MNPIEKKTTLCWDCQKATGKCSWSEKLIPVEGWTAEPTYTASSDMHSYRVIECPEFVRDKPKKRVKEDPVKPTTDRIRNFRCGECGRVIGRGQKFCGKCGRAVDWSA